MLSGTFRLFNAKLHTLIKVDSSNIRHNEIIFSTGTNRDKYGKEADFNSCTTTLDILNEKLHCNFKFSSIHRIGLTWLQIIYN